MPQPTIAAIESGRQDPRFETVRKLLLACDAGLEVVPAIGKGVDVAEIRRLRKLSPRARVRDMVRKLEGEGQLIYYFGPTKDPELEVLGALAAEIERGRKRVRRKRKTR